MKMPEKFCPPQACNRSVLRAQCMEAEENIRRFEKWVEATPWLDQAMVELAMPWFSYICFDSGSKALVSVKLGETGWKVGMSGEIRKVEEGVTVAVAS